MLDCQWLNFQMEHRCLPLQFERLPNVWGCDAGEILASRPVNLWCWSGWATPPFTLHRKACVPFSLSAMRLRTSWHSVLWLKITWDSEGISGAGLSWAGTPAGCQVWYRTSTVARGMKSEFKHNRSIRTWLMQQNGCARTFVRLGVEYWRPTRLTSLKSRVLFYWRDSREIGSLQISVRESRFAVVSWDIQATSTIDCTQHECYIEVHAGQQQNWWRARLKIARVGKMADGFACLLIVEHGARAEYQHWSETARYLLPDRDLLKMVVHRAPGR